MAASGPEGRVSDDILPRSLPPVLKGVQRPGSSGVLLDAPVRSGCQAVCASTCKRSWGTTGTCSCVARRGGSSGKHMVCPQCNSGNLFGDRRTSPNVYGSLPRRHGSYLQCPSLGRCQVVLAWSHRRVGVSGGYSGPTPLAAQLRGIRTVGATQCWAGSPAA